MKIKGHKLYSFALGLAYLSALQVYPAQGMASTWDSFSRKAYALRYIAQNCAKNWVTRPSYTYEKPFDIPAQLPSPQDIASQIAGEVGAQNFLRGASTSAHQCGKLCTLDNCDYSRFAQEHNLITPHDERYQIDWDKHYKNYIDYAKDEMHLNALRFSIEWALVQPSGPDSFDNATLDRYADMFKYMIKKGITPVVCFHHYTNPCWFTDRGGFEQEENINYFVDFCNQTYTHIIQKVASDKKTVKALHNINAPLWATYNAPVGYAFRGYRQNTGAPSIKSRSGLGMVAEVSKNMLEAHVHVYKAMKQTHKNLNLEEKNISAPQIGFLKNIHQTDPANETWAQYIASPITRMLVSFADMIQNGAVYNFFTNGVYQVHIPFAANIKHFNEDAPKSLDFIGLNYYANRHMMFTKPVKPTDKKLWSDNVWYYRYPQGMYRAIVELSENIARPLNIPLIVAENGIATNDDEKRARFYHEYLYAMNKAVQDGYKIYGYLPWTLADNYEWPSTDEQENTQRRYGLCSVVSPEKIEIKEGSKSYLAFVEKMNELETA